MSPNSRRNGKRKRPSGSQKEHIAKRVRPNSGTSLSQLSSEPVRGKLLRVINSMMDSLQNKDTFVYPPLKEKHGQDIRVLVIQPGQDDDPVNCKLVPSSLPKNASASSKTESYPYTALSYYWGDGKPAHPITITNYSNMIEVMQEPEPSSIEKATFKFRKSRKHGKEKEWQSTGKLHVRSNLYVALKTFRKEDKEVTVWIDALCIDQNDDFERSAQVKQMHELYIQAKKVKVWLGDESSGEMSPKRCFKFLREILKLSSLDKLLDNLAAGGAKEREKAMDVVKLMSNTWFTRRWIIQELALAKKARIVYGKHKMLWSDFADAIAIFIKSQERIGPVLSKMIAEEASTVTDLRPIDGVKNLGANALVDFINNLFRRTETGDILQRMMTVEGLVSNLLAFEATNPRDTIYAVLSLAKDTHNLSTETNANAKHLNLDPRLAPAYQNCLLDVYTNFIDYCIDKSDSLDILLRHWAPSEKRDSAKTTVPGINEQTEDLPSWIPSIQRSSYGSPSQRIRGRSNGDGFVGTSVQSNQKTYNATLSLLPEKIFEKIKYPPGTPGKEKTKTYSGNLFVKGIRIGHVEATTQRAAQGMIFKEWFELAGFDHAWWKEDKRWARGIKRVPDAFWRTIVADRGADGKNPPSWYPRACLECLNNLRHNGDLSPNDIFDLKKISTITKSFVERVKDVVWERSFVKVKLDSEENKFTYGLAPRETQAGDIVCVLFGCSVPVMLRQCPQDGVGDARRFQMIGECFVYGMMDGEAVGDRQWAHPYKDAELFQLR